MVDNAAINISIAKNKVEKFQKIRKEQGVSVSFQIDKLLDKAMEGD